MKLNKLTGLLIFTLVLGLTGPVLAQPRGAGAGAGKGPKAGRFYDLNTVTTIKGTVESLETLPSVGRRGGKGMEWQGLVLKTDKETINVHLGPVGYASEQGVEPKVGDTIEVTGSKITRDQKTVLLAAEVKANDKILKLRDEQGRPLWRGWRRGGPGAGN
ncbi:MAG: DNA-binding protein [Desulfobacca sp.]|nr:DNA-binding protein [Desulfobacca sp.]